MMRRKYIALLSSAAFIVCFLWNRTADLGSNAPNALAQHYFEYPLVLLQIIFVIVVYRTKSNDTKNITTGFSMALTFFYIFYSGSTLISW
ncbi:MAG: hypothetical protein ACXVPQ_03195 [Bacteroidia bacterium]